MDSFNLLYNLSLITINAVSGAILLSAWLKVAKADEANLASQKGNIDYGLFWLAISFFSWAVSGGWTLCSTLFNLGSQALDSLRNFLSIANNIFLLLSIPYFDHVPEFLKPIQSFKRLPAVILTFGIGFALISIQLIVSGSDKYVFYFPGFLFSAITGLLIGMALVNTFFARGFRVIAYLAAFTLLLMIFSQLPSIWSSFDLHIKGTVWNNYLLLVPKVVFSLIILSLAMSKVHEMSETPESENISLKFLGEQEGKYWKVALKIGPSYQKEKIYLLSTVEHENLLMFAAKKLLHGESEAANLYIQDFKSGYNAIKRIWLKFKVARKDIFYYYPQSAKYRLRIPQNNIKILNLDKLLAFDELRIILKNIEK